MLPHARIEKVNSMNPPSGRTAVAALMITASTYITYALGLVVSALIARSIGPEDFGRYSYIIMLVGVMVIFANNGLTTSGIRFVSECLGSGSQDAARHVHGWLLRGQFLSQLLIALAFLAAMRWLQPTGWAESMTVFAAIVVVCIAAKSMFLFDVSIAKGYRTFKVEAVTNISVSISTALAAVVMFLLHAALLHYLMLFVVSSLAYWLVAAHMLRRLQIKPVSGGIEPELKRRVRNHLGWTIVLTLVAALSNKSIETYLLNALTGPAEVAYFAIAAGLTRGGVDLLSSGLTTVLMPAMAHAFGAGGHERVNDILARAVRYFHFLGLMLAGVGVCVSVPAIALMYGARYEPVVAVLRVMMLVSGLTLCEGAFGALLSITDHQRARAGFAMFSVSVNAIAAFLLIPKFGLTGAVMAHAISRGLLFIAIIVAIKKVMPVRLPLAEIVRLTLAGVLAAALAALILTFMPGLLAGIVAAVAFGLAFVTLTVVLRAWEKTDATLVLSLIDRLPGKLKLLRGPVARWEQQLASRH
jgi:O-antigen/teichoic acid export membrane protein